MDYDPHLRIVLQVYCLIPTNSPDKRGVPPAADELDRILIVIIHFAKANGCIRLPMGNRVVDALGFGEVLINPVGNHTVRPQATTAGDGALPSPLPDAGKVEFHVAARDRAAVED